MIFCSEMGKGNRDQFIKDIGEVEKTTDISEKEKEVLLVMGNDKFGQLLISKALEGTIIGNNFKTLVNCNPREEAGWRATINKLEEKGYIAPQNIERSLYVLLDKGYLLLEDM